MDPGLQFIIGTDKRNPVFSIYRKKESKEIYVFYGASLMQVIKDLPDNPELKIMLAQMYNAKVNASHLIRHFGYSYPTLKRWGEALKSGSAEELVRALSGQGAPRKLTKEIEGFVRVRFAEIYRRNKYTYSSVIREEIEEIFKVSLSSETLRPLFTKLKADWHLSREKKSPFRPGN